MQLKIKIFFTKKTPRIVKHNTFNDSEGVSLKIATLVQYFNASFGVKLFLADHSACDRKIESKSNKILLISVAVSQIDIPLSKTKITADREDNKI